jgi:hypothetical protein
MFTTGDSITPRCIINPGIGFRHTYLEFFKRMQNFPRYKSFQKNRLWVVNLNGMCSLCENLLPKRILIDSPVLNTQELRLQVIARIVNNILNCLKAYLLELGDVV